MAIFAFQCAYAAGCSTFGSCQFCAPSCVYCTEPTPAATNKPAADVTAVPCPTEKPADSATATPNPTEKPVQNTGSLVNGKASEIINQVNAERAKYGLGALKYDETLTQAASVRAKEIADTFSHTRPDGTSWSTVSSSAYAENIARGYKTVDKVMVAWLTSEGHRKNIMNGNYTSIGVAVYEEDGILHWVQLFGKN